MYKCNNCKKEFIEPNTKFTTYEQYYGVSSEFPNSHLIVIEVCPYCDNDDISEVKDND